MKKTLIFAALVLLTLIVLSPLVLGQSCNVRRVTVPTTYAPVGSVHAPTTIIQKSYGHGKELYYFSGGSYYKYPGHGSYGQLYYYENGYYYPYYESYNYKETIILVPKAIQVEVNRDHYYSIDGAAQQSLLADAIVGRLLRLQSEGKIVTGTGTAGSGRLPTGPVTKTSPTGEKTDSAAQEAKAGDYQNEALLKVVNNSCAKCHGAASKYTKLVTADGKLTDLPAGKVWECFGLVNTGEMPKGGKSLGDEEVKLFYEWAKNAKR